INVSGKIVEEVDEEITSEIKIYTLELKERGNNIEQIKAVDIGLKYHPDWKAQNLNDKQNSIEWFFELFNTKKSKTTEVVAYDEKLLKKCFNNLSCFDSSNIIEPQNPSFQYTDNGYAIVDEIYGDKINKDILYNQVVNAILKGEITIDLESINCYENPQYTAKSQEVIDTKDMLNKYITSTITYRVGNDTEVLDKSTIKKWLKVDKNFEITFDEENIKEYLHTLSIIYNTVGKKRDFATSSGITVEVSGGDYGWLINSNEEMKELITIIKGGQIITKEPIYKQIASSHAENDMGNTYVEINMTKQHLWFYKNGSIVVEGNVVTGNISRNNSTPVGIYRLKFKQKDATLKGAGYNTHVNFWMPFNGGIGIHDANWRSNFGGKIYMTRGSHGCVNAPQYLASIIFNNIDEGTPVICFYE
ncbi:MAG TPA: peptidoglycan binding domain-containing protein, partial [Clostridium sp.]